MTTSMEKFVKLYDKNALKRSNNGEIVIAIKCVVTENVSNALLWRWLFIRYETSRQFPILSRIFFSLSLSLSFALSFTKLMIMQVMTASNVIRLMSHRIECLIVTWTFDIQNDYPLTTMCSLWNAYKIFKLMCYLSFQAVDCDLTATIVKDWVAQRNLHNKLYELLLKCAHFYVNVSRMRFFCVWLI